MYSIDKDKPLGERRLYRLAGVCWFLCLLLEGGLVLFFVQPRASTALFFVFFAVSLFVYHRCADIKKISWLGAGLWFVIVSCLLYLIVNSTGQLYVAALCLAFVCFIAYMLIYVTYEDDNPIDNVLSAVVQAAIRPFLYCLDFFYVLFVGLKTYGWTLLRFLIVSSAFFVLILFPYALSDHTITRFIAVLIEGALDYSGPVIAGAVLALFLACFLFSWNKSFIPGSAVDSEKPARHGKLAIIHWLSLVWAIALFAYNAIQVLYIINLATKDAAMWPSEIPYMLLMALVSLIMLAVDIQCRTNNEDRWNNQHVKHITCFLVFMNLWLMGSLWYRIIYIGLPSIGYGMVLCLVMLSASALLLLYDCFFQLRALKRNLIMTSVILCCVFLIVSDAFF